MKKIFFLMAAALMSLTMMASTVADLKPISRNWAFVADDITASGTVKLEANTLYAGDLIFTPTGNNVSTSKGQSTINGQKYYNCLRLKNAQDRLAFAVKDKCTVTFYTETHAERGILVSTEDNNVDEAKALAKQPVSTPVWSLDLPAAGTYYLTSFGKDFFFAGFTVAFEGGGEAVTEYVVTYVNTDGTIIGRDTVPVENAKLTYKYGVQDVKVPAGKAFRGWFNAAAAGSVKVAEGTAIENDLRLYAQATDIEEAIAGNFYVYDLTKPFYPEDHECISITGAAYSAEDKGWKCEANAVVSLTVAPYVYVSVNGQEAESYSDTNPLILSYGKDYILQSIRVYNVAGKVEKSATGYYIPEPGDGAALLMILNQVQAGDKIFLPNGTYDLGQAVLTEINKNNISLIGQSMEGTIIKNAPDASTESIDKTATIKIAKNVTGTYLQDLTLQNALDYYKNNDGRAVALQDCGTKTVCKNVRLLSYQDTYYSNLQGAVKYFEDCEIHGTVDFICGDGSVYFYGTELVCEQRSTSGGGQDAITASNADATKDKGYVFNYSTVKYAEGIEGTKPVVSFGRSWNNAPKCIFLNTFLDDSNGELNMYKDASAQKDKISRWTLGAMNALPEKLGEYNSVNAKGENVTPASNNVTFVLNSNEKQMETVLTADEAATYTMEYTLGDWAATAKADAKQEVCDLENIDPAGIYLVVNDPESPKAILLTGAELSEQELSENAIVRKANARGGFGVPAGEEEPQGIETISESRFSKSGKMIREGQLVIFRDGKMYDVLGHELVK